MAFADRESLPSRDFDCGKKVLALVGRWVAAPRAGYKDALVLRRFETTTDGADLHRVMDTFLVVVESSAVEMGLSSSASWPKTSMQLDGSVDLTHRAWVDVVQPARCKHKHRGSIITKFHYTATIAAFELTH